jgi:hypothetical protein
MRTRGFSILTAAVAATVIINVVLGGQPGGFYGIGRPAAWLLTTAVFIGLLAYVGNAMKQRLDGIFIDDRNRISLSRFQLVLWTVLLVSALMTAGLSNAALGDPTPLVVKVPPEVWALLGIGAFSFVTSPVLVDSRKKDEKPTPALVTRVEQAVRGEDALAPNKPIQLETNVPTKEDAPEARWMDIIRGDTTAGFAQIDVSKVQQLAFTILLIAIYAAALYNKMTIGAPMAFIKEFPPIDGSFVALLGLSHAAYLASKKTAT